MLEKPVQFLLQNQWQIWLSHPTYFQVQEKEGGVKGKEKREVKNHKGNLNFLKKNFKSFFGYALW